MPNSRTGPRPDDTVSWPYVYLAIAAIGLVVLAFKRLHAPLIRDVSGLALATVILIAFTLASLVHWRVESRSNPAENEQNRET